MTNFEKFQPQAEQNEPTDPITANNDFTAVHPVQPGPVFAEGDADVAAVHPIQPDEGADVAAVHPIQPYEDVEVTAVQPGPMLIDEGDDTIVIHEAALISGNESLLAFGEWMAEQEAQDTTIYLGDEASAALNASTSFDQAHLESTNPLSEITNDLGLPPSVFSDMLMA